MRIGWGAQAIAWVGAVYGLAASVYLLVWYVSAFKGSSAFSLLDSPSVLTPLLIVHFVIGSFAFTNWPKHWIPVGPPRESFALIVRVLVIASVVNLICLFPMVIRYGFDRKEMLFTSVFLCQTLYTFARFSAGYVAFGAHKVEEQKILTVLEAVESGDIDIYCEHARVPRALFDRWRAELENGPIGPDIKKVEVQRMTRAKRSRKR